MTNEKKYYTWLKYALLFGVGIFLVWWQLKNMSPVQKTEFQLSIKQADYKFILPITVLGLLSHYIRAIRWKLLMEPMAYFPKTKNVFSAVMVGYLANSAIPRLGEVIKCSILVKYEKLKIDKLVGTVLIERTVDLLCFIFFIIITIVTQIDLLSDFVGKQFSLIGSENLKKSVVKITLLFIVVVLTFFILRTLVKKYPNGKLLTTIKNFITGIKDGFFTILKLKKKQQFICLTIVMWALYLIQIYIGFFALAGTAKLGLGAACSVLTLVTLAMIITPGGIGTFPIFVMQVLLIYGVTKSTGQAFGWIMWGVSTALVVVTGFICLLLLPYFNKRKKDLNNNEFLLASNINE